MEKYFFSAKKMCVGYEHKPLIKDIEIALFKGEILSLIGANGAGKSTVLKSIAGQLQLLGGTVYLGEDVLAKAENSSGVPLSPKIRAKKMSMLFTDRLKAELKSCRDVVATGRHPYTGWFGALSKED